MLFEIQRLCVFLQEVNKKAWSTKDLTQSFGWHGGEAQQQQDIQELNRILFEAIEKALKGTFYETLVQDMYFGVNVNYITCLTCGTVRSSEEQFLDIPLMVDGRKDVNEALDDYFKLEEIEGVGCELCDKNTTATRGPMLTRLPPVLTFNLIRIKYDMVTFDRIKINDRFEYPLELDMSKYLAPTEKAQAQKTEPDLVNYELKAVIIHKGGPYGGHYHAYIKDDFKEGNWNLQVPEKFEPQPVEIKSKKEESASQQEKKEVDIKEEDNKAEEEKKLEEEKEVDWNSLTKK